MTVPIWRKRRLVRSALRQYAAGQTAIKFKVRRMSLDEAAAIKAALNGQR